MKADHDASTESSTHRIQPDESPQSAPAGLSALCAIARLHQVPADPEQLAHRMGWAASHRLCTDDLLLAARQLGLKAKLVRSHTERLGNLALPALALLDTQGKMPRTVILAQCDGRRVLIQDPSGSFKAGRPVIEPIESFSAQWSGELILIASRASLAGALARFDFSWFVPSIVKHRRLLGEVLLVSLFLQLFALVSPLFFQVVMDKVLVHHGVTTLDVLVTGLLVVVVFESALTVLRSYVFSHTTSRIDVELGARLFRHLLNLPLAYFQTRRVGDSVARVRELENIRGFLTGNAITLVLDVAFSVIFIGTMFFYSVPLTLVVLASLPLYLGLSFVVVPVLRARLNEKFARGAENQALLVETVTGIQTVKAGALEPALARRWDNQLAAYLVESAADVVVENAGEGADLVQSAVTYALSANVENLTLTGTTAINGTGNALDNVLTGNSANNTLSGGAGDDTLVGGAGADSLAGGVGNDTYVVNVTTDVVTESANEGTDMVQSAVSWTLGANVENLTLTGTGAINGTGNALANVLIGNGGANSLSGLAGDDTLDGGAGADTLIGGAGADQYLFGRGYGIDTIQENDTTAGVKDRVQFGANVLQSNVSFSHVGNNLEALINGTSDKIVVQNWYLGSQYHVEEFRFSDGTILADTQLGATVAGAAPQMLSAQSFDRSAHLLVEAMAAFDASASADATSITYAPPGRAFMGDIAAPTLG